MKKYHYIMYAKTHQNLHVHKANKTLSNMDTDYISYFKFSLFL